MATVTDDLLIKYLLGEASPEEALLVNDWQEANPGNKKYLEDFSVIWNTSQKLGKISAVDEQEAWKRFKLRADGSSAKQPVIRRLDNSISWLRIAAVFLLITAAAWFGYSYYFMGTVNLTAATSTRTETLPDGSVITLNKNSSLSFQKRFAGKQRNVKLTGEAFFNVTPNKQKPFVIDVAKIQVTVV